MMHLQQLTSAEESVMMAAWKLENFYFRDLMEALPQPKPHQNTISTYMKILLEKGFLQNTREGRIYKYQVLVPEEAYRGFMMKNLIEKFYHNSGNEVLNYLFAENLITNEDLLKHFSLKIEMADHSESPPKSILEEDVFKSKKLKKDKKKKKK